MKAKELGAAFKAGISLSEAPGCASEVQLGLFE